MADYFKVYSGDYSKDGYNQGITDSKEKSPKNKFKFFQAVNPINYVWNFSNAYESFMQNYDKGYLDGQRVENEVYTKSTQGATMANENYAYHLQLLQELERSLSSIQSYVTTIEAKYLKQINAMEGAGFFDDYIQPLQQRYAVYQHKMQHLQNTIDQHKAKIALHKEAISNLQNDARR